MTAATVVAVLVGGCGGPGDKRAEPVKRKDSAAAAESAPFRPRPPASGTPAVRAAVTATTDPDDTIAETSRPAVLVSGVAKLTGGGPAGGAWVRLHAERSPFGMRSAPGGGGVPSGTAGAYDAATTAGADGAFRMSAGPVKSAFAAVHCGLAGRASMLFESYDDRSRADGGAGPEHAVRKLKTDFTLPPAASISGRVVGTKGRPMAGVTVIAVREASPLLGVFGIAPSAQAVAYAVTGPDGVFRMDDAASGPLALSALAPEHPLKKLTATAPATGVEIRFADADASVAGNVFDHRTREAVAGVTVTLTGQMSGADIGTRSQPLLGAAERATLTDGLGAFAFRDLTGGQYTFDAYSATLGLAPTDAPGVSPVSVGESQSTGGLTLFVYPGHTLTGKVTENNGRKPVAGATVEFPAVKHPEHARSTVSGADGTYRLEGAFTEPDGRTAVRVKADGYRLAQSSQDFNVPESDLLLTKVTMDQLTANLAIRLTRFVNVSGRVRTPEGAGIAARVSASGPDDRFTRNGVERVTVATDADGSFTLLAKPYSVFRVRAESAGNPVAYSDPQTRIEDEPLTGVDVVVRPAVSLEGLVTGPDDTPATNAKVVYYRTIQIGGNGLPGENGSAQAHPDGTFRLENLPPGALMITAMAPGYASSETIARDVAAEDGRGKLTLKLRASHFISGRVTDAEGKPVAGAKINASSRNPVSYGNASTGPDGRYRIDGLAASTYELYLWAANRQDHKSGIAVDRADVDFVVANTPDDKAADTGVPGAFAGRTDNARRGKTTTFVGRVVDWKTGAPVVDFEVENYGGSSANVAEDDTEPGKFFAKGLALSDNATARFLIRAKGYVDLDTGRMELDAAAVTERKFPMGPGGTVVGRAVKAGASPEPVPGVKVEFRAASIAGAPDSAGPDQKTATGADGTFRFSGVAPGSFVATLRPGAPLSAIGKNGMLNHGDRLDLGDILIAEPSRVTGRVTRGSGDKPVPTVTVTLWENGNRLTQPRTAKTDADGAFAFADVTPGDYVVTVDSVNAFRNVIVETGKNAVVAIRLGSGTVTGRLLKGEQGVTGAVKLVQADGIYRGAEADGARGGAFEFKDVPAGRCQLTGSVSRRSGGEAEGSVELADGGTATVDLRLAAGRIVGKVLDAAGAPLPRAAVSAQPPAGSGIYDSFLPSTFQATADEQGAFAIDGLPPGVYALTARRRDGKPGLGTADGVTVPETGDAPAVTITVGAGGGTLVSTVLNMTTAAPIKEAWCILGSANGRFDHGQTRGDDGMMTIPNVPAGTYQAQISSFGFSIVERSVEVKEGETLKIDDVLYDAGAVKFTATDKDGTPLKNCPCTMTPDDTASIEKPRAGTTNAQGIWVVRGLYPGVYTISANPAGKPAATVRVTIVGHQVIDANGRVP